MIKELDYPSYSSGGFQRISWGAVFAGTVVTLAVLVLLTSLGAGIGLVSAPAAADASRNAILGIGIGSGIWMLLSGIAAYYCGGWVAGRLTGIARISESVIHGIVSWAAATVMLAFVFTSAIGALGAASSAIGNTLNRSDATAAAQAVDRSDLETAAKSAGGASLFAFLMVLCNGLASGYGARAGPRVLKPIPMSEVRRERAGV